MDSIGVHSCSLDGSDYAQNLVIFLKVTLKWCSLNLEMFLDQLDDIIKAHKIANIGCCCHPRGPLGCQHCFSNKVNELAMATKNLYYNCYNAEWQ